MEYVLPGKNTDITTMSQKVNSSVLGIVPHSTDRSKEWHLELQMERLRSKSSQLKNFADISKAVRMGLLDKRHSLDSVEKSQLQKSLDTLQHEIKVKSLQGFVERVESLTRQLGLKFVVGALGIEQLFISSEMFYLEILLDSTGAVKDVKVTHDLKNYGTCDEFVRVLSQGDFSDFASQLEGLSNLYQINAEKHEKAKAFVALQALEADLGNLYASQGFIKDPMSIVHRSPVGALQKRRGGHPMKLTYFVSPYELLNADKASIEPKSLESVTAEGLGLSATVSLEGSAEHILPIAPVAMQARGGQNTPTFVPLSPSNSMRLPACFVLRLDKPLPLCTALAEHIQRITDLEVCGELGGSTHPLLSLITQHCSKGAADCAGRGMFVTLPDQNHCYFMTERRGLEGLLVSTVPFSHPCHVPQILHVLRQQALFNTLVASCVRPHSKQDVENSTMFELGALSYQHMTVSLEHPTEEAMATVEIDLADASAPRCRIHTAVPHAGNDTQADAISRILQLSMSLPITLRALIKTWEKEAKVHNGYNGLDSANFSLGLGAGDPGGDHKMKEGSESGGSNRALYPSGVNHPHQNYGGEPNNMALFASSDMGLLQNTAGFEKKKQRKRHTHDDIWRSPKRKPDDCELMLETSSSDSNSLTVSDTGVTTPNSVVGFPSDLELSGLDPIELIGSSDRTCSDFDNSGDGDNIHDMIDAEDMLKASSRKSKKSEKKSHSITLDLGEKNYVPPSVSITPITSSSMNTPTTSFNSVLTGMGLERRPGIEIIPIASSPAASLPSSITITPIPSSNKNMDERSRDRKSSKSKMDDKNRLDKKRRRKREESPMGPPEKLPPKQDPLSKPVSVSIKATSEVCPGSPSGLMRKYAASPTHGRTMTGVGKPGSSPGTIKPLKSQLSPKHSPVHSSPKHVISGLQSPKNHGTSSPKHNPSSGSGKPSMSTLKSAASSPSSKSDSGKSKSKDSSRDKERKSSSLSFSSCSGSSSPKLKGSSVKLKQLDLTATSNLDMQSAQTSGEYLVSPSGLDLSKASTQAQARNRKGSLSAVIDKLKSAQHCGPEGEISSGSSSKSQSSKDRSSTNSSKSSDSKGASGKIADTKNQEYMVKPSSDGIKITINKTRAKDSSSKSSSSSVVKTSNSSTSGTGSPKTHTGLKPGVNSGPASKKPQSLTPTSKTSTCSSGSNSAPSSSSKSSNSTPGNSSKVSFPKSTSSSNLTITSLSKSSSKSTGSPKMGQMSDLNKGRDKPRVPKTSDKNIFNKSGDSRRSSPVSLRDDGYPPQLMVEGLIKSLDTKFQIPKLSARINPDDKKSSVNDKITSVLSSNDINNRNDVASKMFDYISKDLSNSSKYPFQLGSKLPDSLLDNKQLKSSISSNSISISSGPKLPHAITLTKESVSDSTASNLSLKPALEPPKDMKSDLKDMSSGSRSIYSASTKDDSVPKNETSLILIKSDPTVKFTPPQLPKSDDKKDKVKCDDILLDFTSKDVSKLQTVPERALIAIPPRRNTPPLPLGLPAPLSCNLFPNSPSVSVHIVKSPAPSPMVVLPSPHSASPCITDDELMDEALVGIGSK